MSEILKHSFSITEDDIIFVNGIELPQRNIFEFLEAGRIQMQNLEKENAELKAEVKSLAMKLQLREIQVDIFKSRIEGGEG